MDSARLAGADLTGVRLTGTKLADLVGANLTGALLTGADLTGVKYDDRTAWPAGFAPPPRWPAGPTVPVPVSAARGRCGAGHRSTDPGSPRV
ncbi:pentapeptide repeat-containing protein [Nocardia sp. BSTN01]|uniref:pentapeptide repeat-containing protein n=1 Tax=Nocardia sp. BSTN01 TaxID=2783665 RepID=UPI00188F2E36|nr:pentapeptide repeat-containing protein [Nocardia sp. BSTN01]MBF4995877.1 pentapeptide repeat-containing protein [Nocardia sp. BSTN01]